MTSNYLPVAFKLAGHYEIVEVLGEDDFEILYLVKDLHMGEKLFVLKELFLPSYSSRNDDNSLNVMAKSKQIFEQTKKDVISEIEVLKSTQERQSPQLYGYFEENNTLYTIMEFMNDANISPYLEVNAKEKLEVEVLDEEKTEPILETSTSEEKKPKSTLFLKILIVCVVLFLGLAFYGYQILQEDKQRIKEKSERNSVTVIKESVIPKPTLESREEKKEELISMTPMKEPLKEPVKEINSSLDGAEYIEPSEVEDMINNDVLEGVPKEEIYQSADELEELAYTEGEPVVFEEETLASPEVLTPSISNEAKSTNFLGTRIN